MPRVRPISMVIKIPAQPDDVFKALTDSKTIAKWSGQKGKVEAAVGGKIEMFGGWVKGHVLAFQKGKILSYTWHTVDWDKSAKPSIVKYTLTSTATGTRVSLKHSGLPDEKNRKEHKAGWTEFVFDPLKSFFGPQ